MKWGLSMAVSTTTFEERVQRIAAGQTAGAAALAGKKTRRKSRKSKGSLPVLVGLGVLTAGAAYAYAATGGNYHWILSLAG